jgi:hypothetical protein
MSETEHLTLVIGLAFFELIFASVSAFMAWRTGRNPFCWFFIGLIPIIGLFAVLLFIVYPLESPAASDTAVRQSGAPGRKAISAQERRLAFALMCWLVLFGVAFGSVKMPKWLATLFFLGGGLVVFRLFGAPPNNDKPNA